MLYLSIVAYKYKIHNSINGIFRPPVKGSTTIFWLLLVVNATSSSSASIQALMRDEGRFILIGILPLLPSELP